MTDTNKMRWNNSPNRFKDLKDDILIIMDKGLTTNQIKEIINNTDKYDNVNWKTISLRLEELKKEEKVIKQEINKNKLFLWTKIE